MIFASMWGSDPLDYFIMMLFTLVAVCIALVLHEVAHGVVALWNGDHTAKSMGRLSLNPLKHFDLIGFIMMMLVGFGYAKPVPVNPSNFKKYRRGLFTVAIAGICMNLILALFFSLFYDLMLLGLYNATTAGAITAFTYLMYFFRINATVNLSLAFFNLLPIHPLDGFRMVETFSHYGNKFCGFMRRNGQYILWVLVGLSFIVSMAQSYAPSLPEWVGYIDILGTYLNFLVANFFWLFTSFWALMMPSVDVYFLHYLYWGF